jgi:hypothetical protein
MLGPDGDLAGALAAAHTALKAPAPALQTSPPLDQRQIVGVKTWFWLDSWEALPPRAASAADYQIALTATPTKLVIDPGDGRGPLPPCTPENSPAWTAQSGPNSTTGCGHTYHRRSADEPRGAYTVTASVSYAVNYTVTDPTGAVIDEGDLEPITGNGAFDITVHQIQAVGRG